MGLLFLLACGSGASAAEVALIAAGAPAVPQWHYRTAIPFPAGTLLSDAWVELRDVAGRPIPCQFTSLATWGPEKTQPGSAGVKPDLASRGRATQSKQHITSQTNISEAQNRINTQPGSEGLKTQKGIKWLGLDFTAPTQPGGVSFKLRYGDLGPKWQPKHALRVADGKDAIVVDNGLIRFTVKKNGYNFIDSLTAEGKEIIKAGSGKGAYATKEDGTICWSANDTNVEVKIEVTGPMLAVIRAEGWHKEGSKVTGLPAVAPGAKAGRKSQVETAKSKGQNDKGFCKFVVRIYAYADMPYLKVQHTWINTEDSDKTRFGAFGLFVPGGGAVEGVEGPEVATNESLALLVKDWEHSEILKIQGADAVIRIPSNGTATTGAFARGGIGIGIRDFVQNYPKEVEFAPEGTWLHFWPRHGETIRHNPTLGNLWRHGFCHEGKWLNFRIPDTYRTPEFSGVIAMPSQGNGYEANAVGVAKTHEMLLVFGKASERVADYHALFQVDPGVTAGGKWNCDSLALGRMAEEDMTAFPAVEKLYSQGHDAYVEWRDTFHDWGMWSFGETHTTGYQPGGIAYKRMTANHHHSAPVVAWYLYFRSGKETYLTQARRQAQHTMDVDICHYKPREFDFNELLKQIGDKTWHKAKDVGGICGCAGFVHWYRGRDTGYDSLVEHYILDYYLTGNLRAWDVAQEHGELVLGTAAVTNERQGDAILDAILDMYMATWEPKYWEQVRKTIRQKTGTWNWRPYWRKYLMLTGDDPVVVSHVIRWADENSTIGVGESPDIQAEAYRLTGNPKYLVNIQNAFKLVEYNRYEPPFEDKQYQQTGDNAGRGMIGYTQPWCHQLVRVPWALKALKDAPVKPEYDIANTRGGAFQPYWQPAAPKRIKHLLLVLDNPDGKPVNLTGRFSAPAPFWFTVIGPDGEIVGRQDFPPCDGNVFTIPDSGGKKGLYAVYFGGSGSFGYGFRAPEGAERLVFVPDDVPVEIGGPINLFVPKGTSRFVVTYSGYWYADPATFNIVDPAGNVRFRDDVPQSVGDRETRRAEIAPRPEETGKVWMLAGAKYLLWKIEGIPDYVVPGQDRVIDPQAFEPYLRRLRSAVLPAIQASENERAARVQAEDTAALQDPKMNGVMEVLHYEIRRPNCQYGALFDQPTLETAQRPGQYLEWLTLPVSPEAMKEKLHTFYWLGVMDPTPVPPTPNFTLSINGKDILDIFGFSVTNAGAEWQGKEGVKLVFESRATSAYQCAGAFRLTVPTGMLPGSAGALRPGEKAGEPAKLRVYSPQGETGIAFGIFEACVRKPAK